MTNLKDSILRLTILMAALLVMPRPGAAQEDGYPALDLMVEAGQTYRDGLAECDASTIGRAGDAYLTVRQTLLADPAGLARQYQKLIPKSAYMIGWCRLRQAEILGDSDLRETALSYFDSVSSDAPGFLGGYARVMTGEIRLLQAVEQKYRLLCQGNLDSAHVEQLTRAINAARSDFAEADGLLEDGADQQALVHIKTEDVFYELARLHSSVGDSAKALAYLDSINYSPQSQSAGPSLAAYSRYCDAVTVLDRYLLALDDPSAKQTVSAQINRFGQVDRPFRLATIARLNGDYNAPIEDYETTAGLTYQRSNLSIPEAHYFRGFAHLGLATNEDSLRGINSAPAQVLGLAKEDFDNYVESVGNLRLDNDERLRYLVARAGHKSLVLGSALGETLSDEELVSLSVDDVKFLIRIAASTHTLARRRCIDALHRFFDAYLPRLQSGTLDDTRTADFEECSTALATRFTRDQALFYKGILQSLEAEGQIGPQAARTFEMAAATMAQVTGDFEAEAEYVRARCLCKARKYDEAEPLLRQLVQDYGSVRALYFYAMAFRGLNPLREAADTTAIKDELHGLMLAVREAIRIAGDRPEYDNFRINAHNMLTESLSGHFRHPDSLLIGGLDQLNCPETLSVDISGWTPELVMYETLSEKAAIGEQFEQESRKDLIGYGLPKLWLAPGQVYCGRSAIPIIANSFAAIPDSVHVDYIWRGRIQFADNDDNTLS
ncbi:MAG: hypothetical protein OEV80_11285, partial [candidate division Zixibacteria bacterium]|nr:hypothetical protein [candidate division Zixibacteria bacterium]